MERGSGKKIEAENNAARRGLEAGEENFIDSVVGKCRLRGGKLLCKIGSHDYEEVGRERLRGVSEETVHLKCRRGGCGRTAWTEWREGKRIL